MSRRAPDMDALRRFAVARTLFRPTTLPAAIARLGFVQADPIRAPARAQDLTLRHRVRDYQAGDLERRYPRLPVEEDFFVNYGFLPRATHAIMHPRTPKRPWSKSERAKAEAVLDFVRDAGVAHPRDVDRTFQHGKVRNWFGGTSNASTQLLDRMHYHGWLRVAGRDGGARLYAVREPTPPVDPAAGMDALIDVIVNLYAPLPEPSLVGLARFLQGGAPQWIAERRAALERARTRFATAEIDGVRWLWPEGENPRSARWRSAESEDVRLLAPFDPIVWDRRRFELLWGWTYRFEAYTPAAKRVRGYYALPLLWQDRAIGWANISLADGRISPQFGYVDGAPPADRSYRDALDEEIERMRVFLAPYLAASRGVKSSRAKG